MEGHRGLVGLFVMYKSHSAKGRGIKSQSLHFFYSFSKSESRRGVRHKKKRKSTNCDPKRREWQTRERRIEEEEPAGVSGMVTKKAFGSFRRRLNG